MTAKLLGTWSMDANQCVSDLHLEHLPECAVGSIQCMHAGVVVSQTARFKDMEDNGGHVDMSIVMLPVMYSLGDAEFLVRVHVAFSAVEPGLAFHLRECDVVFSDASPKVPFSAILPRLTEQIRGNEGDAYAGLATMATEDLRVKEILRRDMRKFEETIEDVDIVRSGVRVTVSAATCVDIILYIDSDNSMNLRMKKNEWSLVDEPSDQQRRVVFAEIAAIGLA